LNLIQILIFSLQVSAIVYYDIGKKTAIFQLKIEYHWLS
jgi:hypothetical protein